jgi:ribosomal protein S18 acetylase RimI-like enzyme
MIRRATVEDAAKIANIHVATWRAAYAGFVPNGFLAALSVEQRTETWRLHLAGSQPVILVAEDNGKMIGWAAGGPSRDPDGNDDVEVYGIYVLPECWESGIGRQLMSRIDEALPLGRSITLWVFFDNQRASRFYEKMGYQTDGASKQVEVGGASLCAVRFRKRRPNQPQSPPTTSASVTPAADAPGAPAPTAARL